MRTTLFTEAAVEDKSIAKRVLEKLQQWGGFDPWNKTFVPIKFSAPKADEEFTSMAEHGLDALALAQEHGVFDDSSQHWLKKAFASEQSLRLFLASLDEYGDDDTGWWVNERYFYALQNLEGFDEASISTFSAMAQALDELADELY